MREPKPNTEEWDQAWGSLQDTLNANLLPTEDGREVRCDLEDFTLMGVDAAGTFHFKNKWTRNYLHIHADGTMTIPQGGANRGGSFRHYE